MRRTWAGTLAGVLFYCVDRLPGIPYIIDMKLIKTIYHYWQYKKFHHRLVNDDTWNWLNKAEHHRVKLILLNRKDLIEKARKS